MEQSDKKFRDVFLQYAIFSSAIAALCAGYFTWSLKKMLIVYVLCVFLGMLVVVPDWDYFINRQASEWSEPMALDEESRNLQRARFLVLKKTAKYTKREDLHPLGILVLVVSTACSVYFMWKFATS